jgi:hypothetical protein
MHIPSDPGNLLLNRLQSILCERPFLLEQLKIYRPENINLSTLLEVLDFLKGDGVAEVDIDSHLKAPSIEWKDNIYKNQSATIDPTTAIHRANMS